MTDYHAPARDDPNGTRATCQSHPARVIRIWGMNAATALHEHPVICSECRKPFMP
jgi:hypothetical protein